MDQLTSLQNKILNYIERNTYIDRASAFRLFSTSSDYSIDQLLENEYIQKLHSDNPDELDWFVLSAKGHAYLNELNLNTEAERKNKRKETLRYWIPIGLDTVLSVTAIIISIIALLKQ